MAKFQCWTIRSNVFFSFVYYFSFFSPAFIKQSILSSFIVLFSLHTSCYFGSSFSSVLRLTCAIFFIDAVTRSNFLLLLFCSLYNFSFGIRCVSIFSGINLNSSMDILRFYTFIFVFFFFRFQTSHSFYFNVRVFRVFFLAIHWLYCRWRQLSPFRNAIIFILRSTTIQGDFLFSGYFLAPSCNMDKEQRCQSKMISDQFSFLKFPIKMYWWRIHNASTRWLHNICLGSCNFQ